MKIVLDNIIYNLQRAGGISVYWYELTNRLLLLEKDEVEIYGKKNDNIFGRQLKVNMKVESKLPNRCVRYLPFRKKLSPKSIFHSSYYRIALQEDVVNIVTVHDFIYERFRKGLPRWIHEFQKAFAVRRADGIICISENTKNDLLRYFPEIGEKRIKVIFLIGLVFTILKLIRKGIHVRLEYLKLP